MSLEDRLYPFLTVYDRLPQPLRGLLGAAYRRFPATWRLGSRYPAFRELAESGEHWDRDAVANYQLTQLEAVLKHASSSPFYQRRFAEADFHPASFASIRDLEKVPLLEKSDLIEHLPELRSGAIPAAQGLYVTTGGSTGVPVGFYLHKGVSRPKEYAFLEAMWKRAGYFEGARVAVIRGQVTSSSPAGRISARDAVRDWLILSSYHLTEERLPEYLEALEKFQPEFLHVYPSAALQLAEFLDRAKQSWRLPCRALLCGSERMTIPQKRLLERVFGCRVYRWYGHSERVVMAGEGVNSELFYFCPQYGFVEFGPPNEDGLCEIIGTSFHNLVMPLIRYRTGDFVRLSETSTSEKEFFWPAVSEIAGREQEFLVSSTGRRISLAALNMHDAIFDGLYAVQFFQEEPGCAEFRYVPTPQFHDSRLGRIESGLRRKLGDDFKLEMKRVKAVEKTARGKHRWLVSRLASRPDGSVTSSR